MPVRMTSTNRSATTLGLPAEIQQVAGLATGTQMLRAQVSLQARLNPALWAVARAVDAVRRTDAAAERAWQDRLDHSLTGCRAIVEPLQGEGSLRPGLNPSSAADLLWTITSLRTWEDLVLQRGWPPQKYQEEVTRLLLEALTGGNFRFLLHVVDTGEGMMRLQSDAGHQPGHDDSSENSPHHSCASVKVCSNRPDPGENDALL